VVCVRVMCSRLGMGGFLCIYHYYDRHLQESYSENDAYKFSRFSSRSFHFYHFRLCGTPARADTLAPAREMTPLPPAIFQSDAPLPSPFSPSPFRSPPPPSSARPPPPSCSSPSPRPPRTATLVFFGISIIDGSKVRALLRNWDTEPAPSRVRD